MRGNALFVIGTLATLVVGAIGVEQQGVRLEVGQTRLTLDRVDGYSFDGIWMTNALILGRDICVDREEGHGYWTEGWALDLERQRLHHSEAFPIQTFGDSPIEGSCEGRFIP